MHTIPITEVATGEVFTLPGALVANTYSKGIEIHRDGSSARYLVSQIGRGYTFPMVIHDSVMVSVIR